MSGESIYHLLAEKEAQTAKAEKTSAYTGNYKKNLSEPAKPTYSTFFDKKKEYDGTNVRFFKQRDAVIGRNVGDEVDPQNFLKAGGGVKHVVPPVHKERIYNKAPLTAEELSALRNGKRDGNGDPNDPSSGAGGPGGAGADGAGGADGTGNNGDNGDGAYGGADGDFDARGRGFGGPDGGSKNFVASNIVEMSNMVPKRRKDQPKYATSRKDFGKKPAYLDRVQAELETERNMVTAIEQQKATQHRDAYRRYVHRLDPAEHVKLVAQLKLRLAEAVEAHNKMPFSKVTVTSNKHKHELEKAIADIEGALAKLDREAIFVYKDDPVNGPWTKEAAMEEARRYAASA